MRPQGYCLVEHRVAAFGIGADADQIAVALEAGEQLLKVTHAGIVLLANQRRHCAADRGFDINRRVVACFGQTARQDDMTVEDRTRRVGNRILLIVAFGQNRIKRGNRAAAADAVTGAFNQRR
ncbi:hypothetical protein D3C76_1497020 [compost metagenome]